MDSFPDSFFYNRKCVPCLYDWKRSTCSLYSRRSQSTSEHANFLGNLYRCFYFVFAWFREQVCIIVCPYGRLQGVLLDNKSIVVAYDHKRGEKEKGRAKFKRNEDRAVSGKGDCIDCFQCVNVCPTE